jgi:translation initiation factor IF-3
VLRELYRDAEARGDALSMVKLDEANDMAKRMHNRLVELSPNEPYIVSEKK